MRRKRIQMADGPHWNVSIEGLAERLNFSTKTLYMLSNHAVDHYRVWKIPKKNGRFRTIEAPDDLLKGVQRSILHQVLPVVTDKIATAFERGKSIIDNAQMHCRRPVVLNLDLKDFFPSIRFNLVTEFFNEMGFDESVAILLSELCTLDGHLPQGAPTSPHLANLILRPFDKALRQFCRRLSLNVTRYADDITVSGALNDGKIEFVVEFIRRELKKYGLRINYRKLRVQRNTKRQEVTGLVVNDHPSVPRHVRRVLRQKMHYIEEFGVIDGKPPNEEQLRSLMGSVGFVLQVHPGNREFCGYATTLQGMIEEMSA